MGEFEDEGEPGDAPERSDAPDLVSVDCHVHSLFSGDSRTPLARIEEAAVAAKIDIICLTDHGTTEGAIEASESFEKISVVVGQECRTWAGEIIGLFLTERIPGNLQPHDVVERIHGQGGLVYLPHPFCPKHNGLRRDFIDRHVGEIDVIEVHNGKATSEGNAEASRFAKEHEIAMAAGSDAHYAEFVGRAFIAVPRFAGPREFIAALRSREATIEPGTYTYAEATWPKRV